MPCAPCHGTPPFPINVHAGTLLSGLLPPKPPRIERTDGTVRAMTDTDIELADAIASVRDQLLDAAHRATGHPVAFEMGEI